MVLCLVPSLLFPPVTTGNTITNPVPECFVFAVIAPPPCSTQTHGQLVRCLMPCLATGLEDRIMFATSK
uniref:Putative secreted protein n=1 Tax=Anopheles darlingi TaxID=43151 RepID=A0A2M4D6X0_ANODA